MSADSGRPLAGVRSGARIADEARPGDRADINGRVAPITQRATLNRSPTRRRGTDPGVGTAVPGGNFAEPQDALFFAGDQDSGSSSSRFPGLLWASTCAADHQR
jgi:hypothetical protein